MSCRACGVLRQHLALAGPGELGLLDAHFLGELLGLQVFELGLLLRQRVLRDDRIDLGEPVALLHRLPEHHLERLELAADLRAHLHLLERLQHAGGEHRVLEVGALHRGGEVFGFLGRTQPEESDNGQDDERGNTEKELARSPRGVVWHAMRWKWNTLQKRLDPSPGF
jgi:hypothetical protein